MNCTWARRTRLVLALLLLIYPRSMRVGGPKHQHKHTFDTKPRDNSPSCGNAGHTHVSHKLFRSVLPQHPGQYGLSPAHHRFRPKVNYLQHISMHTHAPRHTQALNRGRQVSCEWDGIHLGGRGLSIIQGGVKGRK